MYFEEEFASEAISTVIFNMKASGIDITEIEKEYSRLLILKDEEAIDKCVEKINELINENIDHYKLINIDKLMDDLINADSDVSVKCCDAIRELQEVSDKAANKYIDLVRNIYKKVYVLLKRQINNGTYNILDAVEEDYQSTLYLSELILEEVKELNNSSKKMPGIDSLNVMISAKRIDGVDADYVDVDILQALLFTTNYAENKKEFMERYNYIKENVLELIKKLNIDAIDSPDIEENREKLDEKITKINSYDKKIRKRIVALILSGLMFGGAGIGIRKLGHRLETEEIALSSVVKYDKSGEGKTLPSTYLTKNKNEVTKILEVYSELTSFKGEYYRYIYNYDLTDINFDSVDDYINFDVVNGSLNPVSLKYLELETTDSLDNERYLNIITQDFNTTKSQLKPSLIIIEVLVYIILALCMCIPYMPLANIYELYYLFKNCKLEKKGYEKAYTNLLKFYEKYKDEVIGSEFLQKEYDKLNNLGAKKYIDKELMEELSKVISELEEKTKVLKKNFEG